MATPKKNTPLSIAIRYGVNLFRRIQQGQLHGGLNLWTELDHVGLAAGRELTDRIQNPEFRSMMNSAVEEIGILIEGKKKTPEEEDMAKKKKSGEGGGDQGGAGRIARAIATIASLDDQTLREKIYKALDQLTSAEIKNQVLDFLANFNAQALKNFARDLSTDVTEADFLKRLNIARAGASAKVTPTKPGELGNAEKTMRLLAALDPSVREAIIEVTGSLSHDSPDDQANFDSRMAALYGDGSEQMVANAKIILQGVADQEIDSRCRWFGVRPGKATAIVSSIKKVLRREHGQAKVTAEQVAAARARADAVWARVRANRAKKSTATTGGSKITVASKYATIP